jgi:hypothetical protein
MHVFFLESKGDVGARAQGKALSGREIFLLTSSFFPPEPFRNRYCFVDDDFKEVVESHGAEFYRLNVATVDNDNSGKSAVTGTTGNMPRSHNESERECESQTGERGKGQGKGREKGKASASFGDLAITAVKALPLALAAFAELSPPPTQVVHDSLATWGGWAANIYGIPSVCSSCTFLYDQGDMCGADGAVPTEDQQRAIELLSSEYGISARLEDVLSSYGDTTLVYSLETLQPPGRFIGGTFHFVGPMMAAPAAVAPGSKAAGRLGANGTSGRSGSSDTAAVRSTVAACAAAVETGSSAAEQVEPALDSSTSCTSGRVREDEQEHPFVANVRARAADYDDVVYVSFGTAVRAPAKFWRIVCRVYPANTSRVLVVCSLGRYADDPWASTTPSGTNVIAARSVPQKELLQSGLVSLFVTHAGMNSIHESLWSAVPMVCIPHHADQPYNANLVDDLGCGFMLDVFGVAYGTLKEVGGSLFPVHCVGIYFCWTLITGSSLKWPSLLANPGNAQH